MSDDILHRILIHTTGPVSNALKYPRLKVSAGYEDEVVSTLLLYGYKHSSVEQTEYLTPPDHLCGVKHNIILGYDLQQNHFFLSNAKFREIEHLTTTSGPIIFQMFILRLYLAERDLMEDNDKVAQLLNAALSKH